MNIFQGKKIKLLSDNFNQITLNLETGEVFCGGAQLKFGTDYILVDSDVDGSVQVVDHDEYILKQIPLSGEESGI